MDLTANTVSFSDAMNKMSQLSANSAKNVQRNLSLISTAATAMAASVAASLVATIDTAQDFNFAIQKMAQQTATSSESFSKLAYNAKLAGIPMDTLAGSLEKLSRTSAAAQSGNKQAVAAYGALGISVKDLNGPLKDSGDLLVAVSKKMDGFKESTSKTGLEQHLLGRSGAELAPLLHQLATGFDSAANQATLFGVVVGEKAAEQAKKLHESMVQLESVALGLSLRLLQGVSPALEDMASKILAVATSSQGMKTVEAIASDIAGAVHTAGDAFVFLTEHATAFERIAESMAALKIGSVLLPLISNGAKAGQTFDGVGMAGLKMLGNFSGISKVIPVVKNLTDSFQLQKFMIQGLAQEQNGLAAATYAGTTALKAFDGVLKANPVALTLAGIALAAYAVNGAIDNDIEATKKAGDAAVTWGDKWKAATTDSMGGLKAVAEMLSSISSTGIDFGKLDQGIKDFENASTLGERAHKNANDRARLNSFINAPDLDTTLPSAKKDAPAIKVPSPEKIDIVAKKLMELRDAANAAHQALADAGKGVDFERANQAARESKKTIDDLNIALKAKGKSLSESQKAEIIADTAAQVNYESQARYVQEILRGNEQLVAQASAQDILTAAIGRTADARLQAEVDANSLKQDAGTSPEWQRNNVAARQQRDQAYALTLKQKMAEFDVMALMKANEQLSVQEMINSAVLQGNDAREEAALKAEKFGVQQDFRDRGDTDTGALDARLTALDKEYAAKKKLTDSTRAASMNPAQIYLDEAAAIRDAASAADQAGNALSTVQIAAANTAAWKNYLEAVDRTTLAVGSASDGVSVFFRQMSRETDSAALQVHDVLGGAFESLNGVIEKMVGTQTRNMNEFIREMRNEFAGLFRSISASIAKVALQKVEQTGAASILGMPGSGDKAPQGANKTGILAATLGLSGAGGKGMQSTLDSLNKTLADLTLALNNLKSSGDPANAATPFLSTSGGGSVSGGGAFMNEALGFATSTAMKFGTYGGGFALGGDVQAGMSYDVGEMGKETFTPTTNGYITPNNKLNNGTSIRIDARGSNDPAQTEFMIHRAMQSYVPAIIGGAMQAMQQRKTRMPVSNQ